MKRYKRGQRNRRKKMVLFVLVLALMVAVGPFVWHATHLRHAKDNYDVEKVQQELIWFKKFGGPIRNLEMIVDSELWLDLTMGTEGGESKLESYQDDQHQFWLYELYLREGNLTKAQRILDTLSEKNLNSLGKGLMLMATGDSEQCRKLLGDSDANWSKMPLAEQTLRYLTIAQANLALGDQPAVQSALEAAQDLNPNNPACLTAAFDLAIKEEQWTKADELSRSIDAQSWRPPNVLYETKKAILALHTGNQTNFAQCLSTLGKLPQGDIYVDYVKGILAINDGDLDEGRGLLENALTNGLEGDLRSDAQNAVNQISEREQADPNLRAVVSEYGEHW